MTIANLICSAIIVILVALGVTACKPEEATTVMHTDQSVKVSPVTSVLTDSIRRFPARIAASETANIAANVSGQILSVPVSSGEKVKAGTLLISLDSTDYSLALAQAQANYDLAKVSYERITELRAQNIAAQANYDQSKANFDLAKASLQLARNRLKDTQIYAPFDGTIVKVDVNEFDYINAKQILMTMQSISDIDIEFQLPSDIAAMISTQDSEIPLNVTFDALSEKDYSAYLKEFSADSDRSTHSFDATLTMKTPVTNSNLLPGMNATVIVDMKRFGTPDFLMVPNHSVFSLQGKSMVWRLKGNQVEATAVTLGELHGNNITVLAGLNENDQVVAAGVNKLVDGQTVTIWSGE